MNLYEAEKLLFSCLIVTVEKQRAASSKSEELNSFAKHNIFSLYIHNSLSFIKIISLFVFSLNREFRF